MFDYIDFLIMGLVLYPIAILIHELGHCMWVKIFGATVVYINIGWGNKVFSIGKLNVNNFYFAGGNFSYKNLKRATKMKRIFILFGGVLINFIMFFISLIILLCFNVIIARWIYLFGLVNLFCAVFNLLPITSNGMNLDGKQIYNVIKHGKSSLYGEVKDEVSSTS